MHIRGQLLAFTFAAVLTAQTLDTGILGTVADSGGGMVTGAGRDDQPA
jgi:hypothetical protein